MALTKTKRPDEAAIKRVADWFGVPDDETRAATVEIFYEWRRAPTYLSEQVFNLYRGTHVALMDSNRSNPRWAKREPKFEYVLPALANSQFADVVRTPGWRYRERLPGFTLDIAMEVEYLYPVGTGTLSTSVGWLLNRGYQLLKKHPKLSERISREPEDEPGEPLAGVRNVISKLSDFERELRAIRKIDEGDYRGHPESFIDLFHTYGTLIVSEPAAKIFANEFIRCESSLDIRLEERAVREILRFRRQTGGIIDADDMIEIIKIARQTKSKNS